MQMPNLWSVLRRLSRDGGVFLMASVVTLTLVVAVNAAVFALLNQTLLSPLPYQGIERMVVLRPSIRIEADVYESAFSAQEMTRLRAMEELKGNLGALQVGEAAVQLDGLPRKHSAIWLDQGLIDLLDLRPEIGSLAGFDPASPQPVAAISRDYWTRAFDADPGVIGRTIRVEDQPLKIVGVFSARTRAPVPGAAGNPDIWIPLHLQPEDADLYLDAIVRLPGPDRAEAVRERVDSMLRASRKDQKPIEHAGVAALPLQSVLTQWAAQSLWIMQGVGLLVFLVAAGNIASVFLLRCEQRGREIAIHTLQGAGWRHVYWLVASELLIVCLVSAIAGLCLAAVLLPVLQGIAFESLPIGTASLDALSALVVVLVVAIAGLAIAAIQVGRFVRRDGVSALSGGRTLAGSRALSRTQAVFIAGQAGLSVAVALVTAMLAVHLAAQQRIDPGYSRDAAFLRVEAVGAGALEQHQLDAILDAARETSPELAVGLASSPPLSGTVAKLAVSAGGGGEPWVVNQNLVDPGFFRAYGLDASAGRLIDKDDMRFSRPVAVVNAALARQLGQGGNPIGQWLVDAGSTEQIRYEVIGVVPEIGSIDPFGKEGPAIYVPFKAQDARKIYLLARGGNDAVGALRAALQKARVPVVIAEDATVSQRLDALLEPLYAFAMAVGIGAIVAFALSIVGLIGAVSSVIAKRRRELELRILLGGRAKHLMEVTAIHVLWPCLFGAVIGLGGALVAARYLAGMVFGFEMPALPLLAAVCLVAVALLMLLSTVPVALMFRRDVSR